MPKPHEYRYIAAWHYLTGSMTYYVVHQQELAAKDNAPLTAVFYDDMREKRWITAEEVENQDFIDRCVRWIQQKYGDE